MADDLLAHHARLRRPTALIGWIAGLYLLATLPWAMINFDENWRRPMEGLTAWMILWLVLAVPLSGLAAVLAARLERALSGKRHAMRPAWIGVSLGVFLVAHFAAHLLWSPTYLFMALTENYRRGDHFVGFLAALIPWAFALAGLWLARKTRQRLKARDWTDAPTEEGPRRLPRIPTPWLGAIAYGLALVPLSVAAGGIAVDEDIPVVMALAWGLAGVILAGLGAAWGSWAYEGVDHAREPTRSRPRFVELFGTASFAHWAPFFAMAVMPFWRDWHHDAQLGATLLAALVMVAGTAAWSYGRAARLSPAA